MPLLGGAFVCGAWGHYRAIAQPESRTLTVSFGIGLVALLLIFGFLVSGGLRSDWAWRTEIFLGTGLVIFLGACGRLLYGMQILHGKPGAAD